VRTMPTQPAISTMSRQTFFPASARPTPVRMAAPVQTRFWASSARARADLAERCAMSRRARPTRRVTTGMSATIQRPALGLGCAPSFVPRVRTALPPQAGPRSATKTFACRPARPHRGNAGPAKLVLPHSVIRGQAIAGSATTRAVRSSSEHQLHAYGRGA
jgi:hypothetical protein